MRKAIADTTGNELDAAIADCRRRMIEAAGSFPAAANALLLKSELWTEEQNDVCRTRC